MFRPAVATPTQMVENIGKSPLLPTKLNTRMSFPTKAVSQEIHEAAPVFKVRHLNISNYYSINFLDFSENCISFEEEFAV
jgi:hypothetical protein